MMRYAVILLFAGIILLSSVNTVKAQTYDYANYSAPIQKTVNPSVGELCEFYMEITYPYDKETDWFVPYPYLLTASDVVSAYLYQSRTGIQISVTLTQDGFVWHSNSLATDRDYLYFTVRIPTPSISTVANESMAQVILHYYTKIPLENVRFNVSLPNGYWNFRIYYQGRDVSTDFGFRVEYREPPPKYEYPYAIFNVPSIDYGVEIRYDIIGYPKPEYLSISLPETAFERLTEKIVCDVEIQYKAEVVYPEPYLSYEISTPFYNMLSAYIVRGDTVYSGSIQENRIYFTFYDYQPKDTLYVARDPPHLEMIPLEYSSNRIVLKIVITSSAYYTGVYTGKKELPLGFTLGGNVEVYLLNALGNDVSSRYNLTFYGDAFEFGNFTVTPSGETIFYLVIQKVKQKIYPEWIGLLGWVIAIAIVPLSKRIVKDPKKRVRIIMIAMIFAIIWMFIHPYILRPMFFESGKPSGQEVIYIESSLFIKLMLVIFIGIFILFFLFILALKIMKLDYWVLRGETVW